MKEIEIKEITVLDSGEIRVTPAKNWNDMFQFIYRTATGVVWHENTQSFMSPIPKDWSLFDWYKNIIGSVVSEMGVLLIITSNTKLQNVPDSLGSQINSYVPNNT